MNTEFTAEFFRGNREKLRKLFTGTVPIVLTANGLLQRNADNTYDFRQDSSFWYLTGIDIPDAVLVIDKEKDYIILPDREAHHDVFDGAINSENLSRISGIQSVLDKKTGWRLLSTRLKKVKHVATLTAPDPYLNFYGFYTNPARSNLVNRIKDVHSEIEFLDLRKHLVSMRMVKQPAERRAIQQAINITIDTLEDIIKNIKEYSYEYEIEAEITKGFRMRGARGHAFTPIIASGERACTIHYLANNAALAGNRFVLFDVGAEVENYAADISATVWLTEQNKRESQVYKAIQEGQDFAMSVLKPGVVLRDYEKKCEQFMGEKLRELGLIKTIEHEAVRKYFPHRMSHHLGLDPHDVEDYDHPIEPGMVLAVEPGIYIPEEGIGVRIEDDILITDDGCENLSAKLVR